jgi:hypothetical protein
MFPQQLRFFPIFHRATQWYRFALLSMFTLTSVSYAQVRVTTYHNDLGRTGQNLSETYLTPGKVDSLTFGKLFSMPVDGAIYGQPLYMPTVTIPGQGTHNVVYVATQHDSVFAFDADNNVGTNSHPLWQTSFINSAAGVTTVDSASVLKCDDTLPEVGITSTPVIDPATQTLYVVAKTSENGTVVQRLHALDITTGTEKFGGPVLIQAQVAGTGSGSQVGVLTFDPLKHNQRAGLLLQQGLVYIAWASHCDIGPWHGWVMAYNAQSLAQVAAWVTTPNGNAGGIWQGGAALAADANNVYVSSGNGNFDLQLGGSDAGDTVLKLSPPFDGTFGIADYFTPFNQNVLLRYDEDLGAGGVMLLPDQPSSSPFPHLLATGGKGGTLYLINRDSMGKYSSVVDPDVQSLYAVENQIFSTPAWWNNYLYLGGTGKPLKAFKFDTVSETFATTPSSVSSNLLGGHSPTPSISANGTSNAIVWALDNQAWAVGKPSVLYAYGATNLGNLLYSSKQNSVRDTLGPAVKFTLPTIANGKVYVGTSNQLVFLGLLSNLSLVSGGNQTGIAGSLLPISLNVSLTDAYTKKPIAGATVTFSDGGKGLFSNPSAVTNSTGNASTTYTLPKKTQTVSITFSVPGGVIVKTSETAVPGPPHDVAISGGNNQIGPPSTPLPSQLVAKVRDQYTNGIPGITVTFSDSGAGGHLSPNPVVTNASGLASTTYTTPPAVGTYKIKASVPNVPAATFTETVQ